MTWNRLTILEKLIVLMFQATGIGALVYGMGVTFGGF